MAHQNISGKFIFSRKHSIQSLKLHCFYICRKAVFVGISLSASTFSYTFLKMLSYCFYSLLLSKNSFHHQTGALRSAFLEQSGVRVWNSHAHINKLPFASAVLSIAPCTATDHRLIVNQIEYVFLILVLG